MFRKAVLIAFLSALPLVAVALQMRRPSTQEIGVATESLPDGHVRLTVLNQSNIPITALAAIGTRTRLKDATRVKSVRFFDSVLNPFGPKDLVQNQSYTFVFFGPNPPPSEIERDVRLLAAVFADGSSWGDTDWISVLNQRRGWAKRYNSEALQLVESANSESDTREDLIGRIEQLRSAETKAAGSVAERQMADFSFEEPLTALREINRADGQTVPLSESIALARNRLFVRIEKLSGIDRTQSP